MSCHPALVSHQSTGGCCTQEATTFTGGVSLSYVHGGSSYLGLPTQQTCLSDLLAKLEDVSHTTTSMVTMMMMMMVPVVPVVASLLLLAPGQTGHSAQ